MFKYSDKAIKKLKKIRKIAQPGMRESAGPIFGYFLGPEDDNKIFIVDLFNRTSNSSYIGVSFNFKKEPLSIKWFNNKEKNFRKAKYIGTWHTHPSFGLTPSKIDIETMDEIFNELCIIKNSYLIINGEGFIEMKKTKRNLEKEVKEWKY